MLYLDASAIVKLVVNESESDALRARIRRPGACTIDIAEVEVVRSSIRRNVAAGAHRARAVLDTMTLIDSDAMLRRAASTIHPPALRTIDALHLAAAIEVGSGLDAFLCYDRRLCDAAREHGLPVESPGAE